MELKIKANYARFFISDPLFMYFIQFVSQMRRKSWRLRLGHSSTDKDVNMNSEWQNWFRLNFSMPPG